MLKPNSVYIVFILLAIATSGCVSIPGQVQLIDRQVDGELVQIQANCTYASNADYIKVSQPSAQALDANNISLLNWNIYKGQRDNWASDFRQLVRQQDIVLIQEAVLRPEFQQILRQQQLNWSLNTAFYYDDVEAGVLTASRIKAIRSCGMRSVEPWIRIPKTILVSEYPIANSTHNLLVANIHGINFTLGTEAYLQQIASLAEAIRRHQGPLIVAGDFNTWSDSRMEIVNQFAELLSLEAVTYKNHNRLTMFGNPLDHVFYRGLELTAEESLRVDSSDHNPIKVTFRISPAQLARIKL